MHYKDIEKHYKDIEKKMFAFVGLRVVFQVSEGRLLLME